MKTVASSLAVFAIILCPLCVLADDSNKAVKPNRTRLVRGLELCIQNKIDEALAILLRAVEVDPEVVACASAEERPGVAPEAPEEEE